MNGTLNVSRPRQPEPGVGRGRYSANYLPKGKRPYPPEMVEQVRRLYWDDGLTVDEVAATMSSTRKIIYRVMTNHEIPRRRAVARDQSGSRGPTWKGEQAGYQALHLRVSRARGKPQLCEECGTTDPLKRYEWASLTGKLSDPSDYRRLCKRCHSIFDFVVQNFAGGR